MDIRKLRNDAAARLDGRLSEAWEALAFSVGTWIFFRVLIACCGLFAEKSGIAPAGIFGVSDTKWLIVKLLLRVLMFFVCSAATLSMSRWFCAAQRGNSYVASAFGRLKSAPLGKWLLLRLVTLVLRGIPMLIGSACFAGAYMLCRRALGIYTGNGAYLALAICLVLLGVCMFLYSLYITMLFMLCPFYIIMYRSCGIFTVMRMSCRAIFV